MVFFFIIVTFFLKKKKYQKKDRQKTYIIALGIFLFIFHFILFFKL
jgi:hypothetical protein